VVHSNNITRLRPTAYTQCFPQEKTAVYRYFNWRYRRAFYGTGPLMWCWRSYCIWLCNRASFTFIDRTSFTSSAKR